MLKLQIILGSTRPGRVNDQVGKWIYDIASRRPDLDVELVDIADYNLPLLDEPIPPSVAEGYTKEHTKKWAAKIDEADAFIFVTPEYNRGTSGALKNAIDYLFKEWNNKAVGYVGYGSVGGGAAIYQLRVAAGEQRMADVRTAVNFNLATDFENYSVLKPENPAQEANANIMLDQLTEWGAALKTLRTQELALSR